VNAPYSKPRVSSVGGIASSLSRKHEIGKCGECFLVHERGICEFCGRECADIRDLEHEVKCLRMGLGGRGKDRCRGAADHRVRCTPECQASTREVNSEDLKLSAPLAVEAVNPVKKAG
jgi:hypothetical protein